MKTKAKTSSLSLVFLIFMLVMLYLGMNFTSFSPHLETNSFLEISTSSEDFSMTRVIEFVVDMVVFSL